MKRSAVIAGVLVCAALGVGAGVFVFAFNDDGGGKHKSAATIVKPEPKHDTTTTTKTTDPPKVDRLVQVASEAPVPSECDDIDDDDELDGYEVRKAFVGVSPSVARIGRRIELELRNFGRREVVDISIIGTVPNFTLNLTLLTDKRGRAKSKIVANFTADTYVVTAHGRDSGRSACAALKVVLKK